MPRRSCRDRDRPPCCRHAQTSLAEVEILDGSSLSFRIRGTPVTLTNQAVACKSDPAPVTGHVKTIEILVDRTSIETFVNEGEVSLSACFLPAGVLKVLGVSDCNSDVSRRGGAGVKDAARRGAG